jgi:hypothetical protein
VRFSHSLVPENWFYAGADLLLLLGVVRDLISNEARPRGVSLQAAASDAGQIATIYTYVKSLPEWLKVAHALLG